MKKRLILIHVILLSIFLIGCNVKTQSLTTDPNSSHEAYVVNFKQLRFYIIEILGSAPNCDDYRVVDPNKSREVYLTGADFKRDSKNIFVAGAKYCYSQHLLTVDLSLYENNAYYIDDLTLNLEAYNIYKTFSLDKYFVYEKSDMIYDIPY